MLKAAGVSVSVPMTGFKLTDGLKLFPGGAAMLTEDRVLVVADMHLGCEAALEYQGLSIPRVQTRKIERYMVELIKDLKPKRIIVAGDLKHNFSRNLTQEWQDVTRFVHVLSDLAPLEVVKGNHDNYLGAILSDLGISLRNEAQACGYRVLHGHSGTRTDRPTIIGHLHPSVRLRDDIGGSLKDHCFLHNRSIDMLVLPALSIVAPGLDVVRSSDVDFASPLLPRNGLVDFVPILFSKDKALVFPAVGELRRSADPR